MTDTPILDLQHVSFGYEENRQVLFDLSFSLPKGSYTSLIGHNGSGKSTLAKLILGLVSATEGDIYLFGEKLTKKNLYALRSRVGIVFQNPDNQFVGSTVADDIAFGLENRRVPHEEMEGIISSFSEEVGMKDYLEQEPQNLSGGQKQRVAIAGVLAMSPDLIIFDEATAMLDPKGKKEIASLINKMKQSNPELTILSITHDIEEASQSDRVLVLDQGKLILQGTPKEVFVCKEELKKANLGIPFVYALRQELENRGIRLSENAYDLAVMEEELCQ